MQTSDSTDSENPKSPNPPNSPNKSSNSPLKTTPKYNRSNDEEVTEPKNTNEAAREKEAKESILDVTGKSVDFGDTLFGDADVIGGGDVEGLYLYKNTFNVVPRAVRGVRTLKFFCNEVNLLPPEVGGFVKLERLQVKVSSIAPGLSGLGKLEGLKELELSKAPPRPSVFTVLAEVSGLKCLTKLSVCHFSIRCLPPEIGCLNKLEYLDLSFNKIKSLPAEISQLSALISLKLSNNKLMELPSGVTLLQRLENLDLSNNRLTSLGSVQLSSMPNLQYLYLQHNKLMSCGQIPPWISCSLEGNEDDLSQDNFSSVVEMEVYQTPVEEGDRTHRKLYKATHHSVSSISSSNSWCYTSQRSSKRWKRQHYLQQKARQERLNNSRKLKGEGDNALVKLKGEGDNALVTREEPDSCDLVSEDVLSSETSVEGMSEIISLDYGDNRVVLLEEGQDENLDLCGDEDNFVSRKKFSAEIFAFKHGSAQSCVQDGCTENVESPTTSSNEADESLAAIENGICKLNEHLSSKLSKTASKSKRHYERDLDNPKPCKFQRPTDNNVSLSRKYNELSFCGVEDCLPDGFYDAGRDRPFLPLGNYERNLHFDSREVILLDRNNDEGLAAIALSAQALVWRLKSLNGFAKESSKISVDHQQVASLLALFVSDHFGGSDRGFNLERARKAVSGSNYQKPFVCTCATGNSDNFRQSTNQNMEEIVFTDLCEKTLHSVKAKRSSIVVPLGSLQFGVCRHRALLMKYLCDRMDPPIPCELVRGYLDFIPHAWNVVVIKQGDSSLRMIVDACRPLDVREETDQEYFCRYIPLSRTTVPISAESSVGAGCSFPSFSSCDSVGKTVSSSLVRCKLGSIEAAVKVRTLDVCGASIDEIRSLEYNCLGEVRILGALDNPSIIKMYGHQISSKWNISVDGNPDRRVLQSAIFMEYVEGGSLKDYILKLSSTGEKHVPLDVSFCIARDVASALSVLHTKHIIHRDIKSENVLIDLDGGRSDGKPVVKLCDFDRAVPLRSVLHSCCIAHKGIPSPDVCVGTPRWMAPEVLRAMHKRNPYGLEVDIWSYGCLLFELLTLQVPYGGVSESRIQELIEMGKRPPLPDELLELDAIQRPGVNQSASDAGDESQRLRVLVDLFTRCTEENPDDRPKAADIYDSLLAHVSTSDNSKRQDQP